MPPDQPRRRTTSVRMRILGWYVLLLGVSLVAALLIQRAFLLAEATRSAEEALDQEVDELRQLGSSVDPATGEPFGTDVAAIFDTFLSRNVPSRGEGIVTFVDGSVYATDVTGADIAVLPDAEPWGLLTESERGVFTDGDLGEIRYVAVPLVPHDDAGPAGVFVVTVAMSGPLASVNDGIRLGAAVFGSIFVMASLVAWVVAGRILLPLRTLTDTAQSISDTDLSRRIEVDGDDELAELGRTFNEMLDRLDEAFASQRRFVDDAGHELRTPITVIRGHLEVMGDDPEDRAVTIGVVTAELNRMTRIVDDLLDLATSGQPDFVRPGPVDLDDFVRDVASRASRLTNRSIDVEATEGVVFPADRDRLHQAMMNLVGNATEHTEPGTTIHIGGEVRGDAVALWVRDHGPGIPPEDRERIFRRFARIDTDRRRSEGAGLGLAIVAAIADGHGGTVGVDEPPGGGSVFTISIPTATMGASE